MSRSWEFLQAEAAERALFGDRDAVLALPHAPAAPANRRRRVLRLAHAGRTWFFKEFGRTQWKNRWRFRTTLPHAQDDAEREALVTLALRARGIDAPRPVLRGTSAHGSCYLCAELPGEPLRRLLQRGERPARLLASCARFCGDVLKQGIWLPDLSAEHVFVRQEAACHHFGLLDLHNATLAPPGPPPPGLCRRVLRHFARSVQDLQLRPATALRFATRLLRSAGRGQQVRRLLRGLPALPSAARYEAPGRSTAYAARNPARAARELELLGRIWPGRGGELVLDCPSGSGRLLPFLRQRGHRVLWADAARAMLRAAAPQAPERIAAIQAEAARLPLADAAVDGVVMLRLLHHLPSAAAAGALTEACRVARRFVVVSFFHPCSLHHLRRRLRGLLRWRAAPRHALTLARVTAVARQQGFALRAHAAELPFVKDLWLASFVRER